MSTQTLMKGVLRDTPIHKESHSPLQVTVWASENSHYLRHPELPFLGLLELSRRLMCIISMAYLWEWASPSPHLDLLIVHSPNTFSLLPWLSLPALSCHPQHTSTSLCSFAFVYTSLLCHRETTHSTFFSHPTWLLSDYTGEYVQESVYMCIWVLCVYAQVRTCTSVCIEYICPKCVCMSVFD
jgi:hypothetical protein